MAQDIAEMHEGREGGVTDSRNVRNSVAEEDAINGRVIDVREMEDDEKGKRANMLVEAPAEDVEQGVIKSTTEYSARQVAEKWWDEHVGEPTYYATEVGEVEINRKSIENSLAHRYGQAKLDAITSLKDGFKNAVYLGTMPDGTRQEGVSNHYFAYPINYNGKRNYVFCRVMQDANKNSLYVHEVFVEDKIKKGNTLQTAAFQPHGGIALYRDILTNILNHKDSTLSAENQEASEENQKQINESSERVGDSVSEEGRREDESLMDYARRVSETYKDETEGNGDYQASQEQADEDEASINRYSLVEDEDVLNFLNSEEWIPVYRNMQLINGKLYPPMSGKVGGKWQDPIEFHKWYQSDERLDMVVPDVYDHGPNKGKQKVDENGNLKWKFKLDKGNGKYIYAAYNPYFHATEGMLNDQFAEAQDRPELVVVKGYIPKRILDKEKAYRADKAKDAEGIIEWKPGIIQGQLPGGRDVYLSQYFIADEVVDTKDVAANIAKTLEGSDIIMPTNVVTPQVREELEKLGIPFVKTNNSNQLMEGEHAGDAYTWWYGKDAEKNRVKGLREKAKKAGTADFPVRKKGEKLHDYAQRVDEWREGSVRYSMSDNAEDFDDTPQRRVDAAKEEFGTTDDFRKAGWMLKNGEMLDFSDGEEERTTDHRAIERVFVKEYDERWKYLRDFENDGNIRISQNNDSGAIDLSSKPSGAQMKQLGKFIRANNGTIDIDFNDANYSNITSAYYDNAKASRILADITRFYDEGIKPEGDVSYSISIPRDAEELAEYDKEHGTQITELLDLVRQTERGTKPLVMQSLNGTFKVGNLGSKAPAYIELRKHGLSNIGGDVRIAKSVFDNTKHTQDADHEVTEEEWLKIIEFICDRNEMPNLVTAYKEKESGIYRLYLPFKHHNGQDMMVMIDTNNKDNNGITVTAFGRDMSKAGVGTEAPLLRYDNGRMVWMNGQGKEKVKRFQSAIMRRPIPISQSVGDLSDGKTTNFSSSDQTNSRESYSVSEDSPEFITPERFFNEKLEDYARRIGLEKNAWEAARIPGGDIQAVIDANQAIVGRR